MLFSGHSRPRGTPTEGPFFVTTMDQTLQYISTTNMTQDDWLAYRYTGIGASEVGTILGLDPYKSSIELYYDKIGQTNRMNFENLAMFLGKEQEDFIATMWQHWDTTTDMMIRNYRQGIIVRRCQRVNAYVRNPDYPWLFVSLDRKINKHAGKGEGSLEIKTMNSYESEKWEAGIPPRYVVQLQTQMLVCRFLYGEMAIMVDNKRFDVFPFEKNDSICEGIIERTKEFWDRVQDGIVLENQRFEAERNFNFKKVMECQREIDARAPAPDGSLAYAQFLSDRFKQPNYLERFGTSIELEHAQQHLKLAAEIKMLEERKLFFENQLKTALADHQVLNFGSDGKVYWTKAAPGYRVFRNKVKL